MIKFILFNIAVVIISLVAYESFLVYKSKKEVKYVDVFSTSHARPHSFLGFAPRKNNVYKRSRFYQDNLIYEVTNTIDENGLRISPPHNSKNILADILFFGGSFTYGMGINDTETAAYQLGEMTSGKYRIFNFGFKGYGPHQMLSAIEHNLVEDVIQDHSLRKIVIYQFIYDHLRRVAGSPKGPRYIENKTGGVTYKGLFEDMHKTNKNVGVLKKSLIYRNIKRNNKPYDSSISLLLEIVKTSKQKFTEIYPDSEFHVIIWNNIGSDLEQKVSNELSSNDIKIHLISNILPGFKNNRELYRIHKFDGHPNALANKIIAEYVVGMLK